MRRREIFTRDNLGKLRPNTLWESLWYVRQPPVGMEPFVVSPQEAPERLAAAQGDLEQVFYGPKDHLISKWPHYLGIYDRHFARYRGSSVRFLEIGVSQGGSLDMWRAYLGPEATVVGIDIDPACAARVTPPNLVRIGSQDDPAFLAAVVRELGPFDVIVDDGSHIAAHQRASFDLLFPGLADDGLYVIEDTHTSYWPGIFSGGYRRRGTAMALLRDVVDDMHAWYHHRRTSTPARDHIVAAHVYDSVMVFEKGIKAPPEVIEVPGATAPTAAENPAAT